MKLGLSKTFRSLSVRNYRLFFIGHTISNTGNWMTNVALTLLVLELTHSGLAVGIVAACQLGPLFFLSPFAGSIADRYDKHRLLLITQSLEMVQSIALAALAFMPHPPLIGFYVIATIGGLLLSLDNPLRRSFVAEMVPYEDIPNAVVLYTAIVNISRIAGPALAGLVLLKLSFGWVFIIDAFSYLAMLFCLRVMDLSKLYLQKGQSQLKGSVRAGFRYIASTPILWITFVILAVVGTLCYNIQVYLPLFITRILHEPSNLFALFFSTFAIGSLTSAFWVARRETVRIRDVILGAATIAVTMVAFALTNNSAFALIVIFMVGVAAVMFSTATTALIQIEAIPEMHGRVLALQSAFLFGSSFIGGPLTGQLADVAGARAPIILGGVAALAAAVFGYFAAKALIKPWPTAKL